MKSVRVELSRVVTVEDRELVAVIEVAEDGTYTTSGPKPDFFTGLMGRPLHAPWRKDLGKFPRVTIESDPLDWARAIKLVRGQMAIRIVELDDEERGEE